ncbi:restriction endonuclease subunit S [Clostridium botulinum]|nr:restriction endonuclease subunit S [Clostridium botulinum]MBY6877197.1 restriction endonuclease subunit S [Clostridium botulinum]
MSFKRTELGVIPEHWQYRTVSELIDEKVLDKPLDGNHGGIHPTQKDFVDAGIPFIMASDINNGIIDYLNCKYINLETSKGLKKGFAKERDVLLTHKATIGRVAVVKNIKTPYIVLTPQVTYYRVLNYNKLDNMFLRYYFSWSKFNELFTAWAQGGSTRAYLGITAQQKLPIILPPIKEQKSISSILSSLDEKIEINNEINRKLEKMAQAIFKQWFVDFEFPNEDGKPYKSSGGEMVENEYGVMPKSWSIKSLYDLGEYINGTSFKKDEIRQSGGIPIIKIAELKEGITDSTKGCISVKHKKYYLKNGDVLFSWSGNPQTSIDTFIWHRGDGILNQHIFKVVPKLYSEEFVYLALKYFNPIFMQIASNKQTTGLGHITVSDLKRVKIALPDIEFIDKFSLKIKPIINKMHTINL